NKYLFYNSQQLNSSKFVVTQRSAMKFDISTSQVSVQKIQTLSQQMKYAMNEMLNHYPHLMVRHFHKQVAYTLQYESPEQLLAQGGLINNQRLWLSNTGLGENEGTVCFSIL